MRDRRRRGGGRRAALLTIVLVGCSSGSVASTTAPSDVTSTTAATTTTHVHHDTSTTTTEATKPGSGVDDLAASLTTADLPGDAPCSVGSVPPDGQATFVVVGKLWGLNTDGSVVCLADLAGRNPSWISWSPDGDEVLVGPDTVLRNDGTFVATGYFPDNRSLRWSYPTGKALIAPNAASGKLIWRNAHDSAERIDVSFMQSTTTAAYHPAGKHIAAAGIGNDGLGEGVFVASNRGANAQRVGTLDEGTVSDLSFDQKGDSIVFLHHHTDGVEEVHRYSFSLGQVDTIQAYTDASVSDLVASPIDEGAVAWSVANSTISGQVAVQPAPGEAVVRAATPTEHMPEPLSWLPGQRLLVAAHAIGATADAPYDLWQWSAAGSTHVIDGVSAAAARTPHGPYLELNIVQGSGFG